MGWLFQRSFIHFRLCPDIRSTQIWNTSSSHGKSLNTHSSRQIWSFSRPTGCKHSQPPYRWGTCTMEGRPWADRELWTWQTLWLFHVNTTSLSSSKEGKFRYLPEITIYELIIICTEHKWSHFQMPALFEESKTGSRTFPRSSKKWPSSLQ